MKLQLSLSLFIAFLLVGDLPDVMGYQEDPSWNCGRKVTPVDLDSEETKSGVFGGSVVGEWYEVERTMFPLQYKQSCNFFNISYVTTDNHGKM